MQLVRTGFALDAAEQHLAGVPATDPNRTAIASLLAQALSVSFLNEMEERVRSVIETRLSKIGDARVASFILRTNDGMIRRSKRKEIVETVTLFGSDCGDKFKGMLSDDDISRYSNVVRERHLTAHGTGAQVTVGDIKEAMHVAERILVAIRDSISP